MVKSKRNKTGGKQSFLNKTLSLIPGTGSLRHISDNEIKSRISKNENVYSLSMPKRH